MPSTDELLAEVESGSETAPSDGDGDDVPRSGRGLRSRLAARLRSPVVGLFSPRGFLLALGLSVGGTFAAGAVPLARNVAPLLGVVVAGFALGLGRERRAYLEIGLAGAGTAAVATLLGHLLVVAVGDGGVTVAAVTGGAGLFAAVGGHYFGRDLRAGLTRDL